MTGSGSGFTRLHQRGGERMTRSSLLRRLFLLPALALSSHPPLSARSSAAPFKAPSPTRRRRSSPTQSSSSPTRPAASRAKRRRRTKGFSGSRVSAQARIACRSAKPGFLTAQTRERHRRHQRDGAARRHARSVGRAGNGHRHGRLAARRDRTGSRVRPRRSAAAPGDAAQRTESLQPDRAPAGRHRQRASPRRSAAAAARTTRSRANRRRA